MTTNEIVTKADLDAAKNEIITLLKQLINQSSAINKRYLRSPDVQKMLSISASGLQNLRINNSIPYTKMGGTIYYDYNEIIKVMEKNKS